ncbi:alkaline phosphatase [Teretinema zuelzerae]|nr:alkaline phosphatase [Teretinema zuelzerae]HPO02732.1 alkaline phosphatase [Treponemataceae bacterium]
MKNGCSRCSVRKNPGRVLCALLVLFIAQLPVLAGGKSEMETSGGNTISGKPAKYVFLFIGDGMAMPQISSAEIYAEALASKDIKIRKLGFSRFPVSGLTTTYDAGSFITDSASAGTALASGNKTLNGVVNMDPGKTEKFRTIAEYARDKGMKVGVVSSVSLDHATPAVFYAKVPSRGNYYDIGVQLSDSGFDYFGGGGFLQRTGKKGDQRDIFDIAKEKGYQIVDTREAFSALKPGAGKVIAVNETLQDSSAMPYDIDRAEGDLSLSDFTAKGIELLSDDPDGFFMMVEGGKIDWACHANDAAASIRDTIAFDRAIDKAVAFADKHPGETLIIVTGDHETGGMTIGFAGTQYATFFDKAGLQKMSFVAFDQKVLKPYKAETPAAKAKLADLLPAIQDAFGLSYDSLTAVQKEQLELAFQRSMGNKIERSVQEDQYLLYGGYEPLTVKITQIVNQTAGIGWTSYAHTGVPVATFARGAHQELFSGYYDNTDIFRKMAAAMALDVSSGSSVKVAAK